MTADMEALVERLTKATEGSRDLDAAIALEIKGGRIEWILDGNTKEQYPVRVYVCQSGVANELQASIPRYSESIDAAMTLVPPKHGWALNYASMASIIRLGPNGAVDGKIMSSWPDDQREAELPVSPAIALCISALRARSASQAPS